MDIGLDSQLVVLLKIGAFVCILLVCGLLSAAGQAISSVNHSTVMLMTYEGSALRTDALFKAKIINPGEDLFIAVDRKSTRLNSSHVVISYAVFCLKKKKTN